MRPQLKFFQKSVSIQQNVVFSLLGVVPESWSELAGMETSQINSDTALNLTQGGADEIQGQLASKLTILASTPKKSTIEKASKLDIQFLRNFGFSDLVNLLKHKPRIQKGAQQLMRTIFRMEENGEETALYIDQLKNKAQENHATRLPLLFLSTEVALLLHPLIQKTKLALAGAGSLAVALTLAGCGSAPLATATLEVAPITQAAAAETALATPSPELTETATPTVEPTITFTPEPTLTATIEPTPDPMDTIPEEWRGKIERTEKLRGGPVVAIADLDPEKEDLFRVLQRNKAGEWVPYKPAKGVTPAYEEYFGREWQENIPIPEIKQPLYDKNGEVFPLGYLGKIGLGDDPLVERFWYSGIIADRREIPEQKCVEFVVAFPAKTGDWQFVSFIFANYSQQKNFIGTHLSSNVDASMLREGEYDKSEFGMTRSTNNPSSTRTFAQYILHRDVVGIQIAVGINASSEATTADARKTYSAVFRLKEVLEGNREPDDELYNTLFMGWIIPDSMADILEQ